MGRNSSKKASAIVVGHLTDPGRKRSNNEDAYLVLVPPDVPPQVEGILVVADGMGGHQAGEVASNLAVQTVSTRLGKRGISQQPGNAGSGYPNVLKDIVEEAHRSILSESQGERQGMGTTLTLGLIEGGRLHLAHVGDSRAYMLRDGELKQLSQDHSWVGEEVRAGRLKPEEAESHPRRNLLTRALGADENLLVDTETFPLKEGDQLLLCSDGLHGVVSDQEIADILGSKAEPQSQCDRLVQLANEKGGPDNVTVVLARIGPVDGGSDAITIPLKMPGSRRRRRRIPTRVIVGVLVAAIVFGGALGLLAALIWGI